MTADTRRRRSPKGSRFDPAAPRKRSSGSARRAAGSHAKVGAPPSWSQLPLFVRDAFAFLPPDRTVQLPHDGMTLKLGSRSPVLIDSIEVPAASTNVSDEHVDVVEDDPAPTTVRDDAIPHVWTPVIIEPRLSLEDSVWNGSPAEICVNQPAPSYYLLECLLDRGTPDGFQVK